MPDGLVVTTLQGRVLAANRAFIDLVHLATEAQVQDRSLHHWFGQGAVDALLEGLREQSAIPLYVTTLTDEHGGSVAVEVSAMAVRDGKQTCISLAVCATTGNRIIPAIGEYDRLPWSVQQVTKLVGRVPMKDIVRDATNFIEKTCIETALARTGDNRASAAEILGLSRQSFYVKLHRHRLGSLGTDSG